MRPRLLPEPRSLSARAFVIVVFLLSLGAFPAHGQGPSVSPGSTLRFPVDAAGVVVPDAPIALREDLVLYDPTPHPLDCIPPAPPTVFVPPIPTLPLPQTRVLWNADDPLGPEARLRVRVKAHDCLNRAQATVEQHNDFSVAGRTGDGVVAAQVSATVHMKGFILLMGPGEAAVQSWLNVIDVTPGAPEEGSIVASELIYQKNVQTSLVPDFGLEVGFPSGVGVSIAFAGEGTKMRLDRSFDVGFVTLLQRGHAYRLELTLTGLARRGILPGVSWVGFWAREIQPPDLLEPEAWKASMRRVADLVDGTIEQKIEENCVLNGLLKRERVSFAGELVARADENFSFANLFTKLSSLDQIRFNTTTLLPFDTPIAPILHSCGLPEEVTGRFFIDWLDDQLDRAAAEFLQGSGATMTNLQVSLAGDSTQDIEEHLIRCSPLVELFLPAEFGGRLEEVHALVQRRVDQATEAGLRTRSARKKLRRAETSFARGAYQDSYRRLCSAYRSLG